MENKIKRLKDDASKKKEGYQTSKIRLEQTYKNLKKDFGLKTEQEAEKKILSLSKEVESSKTKRDRLVSRAEKKLEKYNAEMR